MIFNYIKIAFRNLARQRLYSFINISGLAVGLAVCMMIMLYVAHENSYDRFHKDSKRIVAVHSRMTINGNMMNREFMSFTTGQVVKYRLASVEDYIRYFKYFLPVVVNNPMAPQSKFNEDKLLFADAGFFNFFSFKILSGQPAELLSKPFSVVISAAMAKKYFGDENPIGKTLSIKTDSAYTYQITGIAENTPSNSSIEYNFIASASSLASIKGPFPFLEGPDVGPGFFNTYLKLKHAGDTARVVQSMQVMINSNPRFSGMKFSLPLLSDTHLGNNLGDLSNIKYLKIFPVVAILILLLALFNYMNLSTARSTLRAREVGVRKVSGASRKNIAFQFYIESAIFTFLSFILGYLLCYLFKPWFLNVLQLKIDNSFLYSPSVLILLVCLFTFTVLIAGSYPSIALSSFNPAVTLKGKTGKQAGGVTVRKAFTVLQFAISVGLIICGIVIDRQLYYFRHTNTGINRNNVVMIPISGDLGAKYQSLKNDMGSLAGISSVATSNYSLYGMHDTYSIKGRTKDESTPLLAQQVDKNFISTLGLQWKNAPIAGSNLASPKQFKVIINEAAVEKLHLPANPVGTFIKADQLQSEGQITGVLKNFNFTSMQYAIQPYGLFVVPDNAVWADPGCYLYAKVKPHTNLPALLSKMQDVYEKYSQNTPFSYSFMDDAFNRQYQAEDRLASIFSVFTYITVVLAALGLFGLAAFTIEQRTKEIGIRKVLGASLVSINTLLSKDFLKLVVLAIIIASPVAWWCMHNWLQGFAYRISISWWMFAAAGSLAIITAVVTVSYHAIKAGIANPVNSLRSE